MIGREFTHGGIMTPLAHPVDVPATRPIARLESTVVAAPSVVTERAAAFEYVSLSHIKPAPPMTAEQAAEVMAYERYLAEGESHKVPERVQLL
jgi:hypothetical protein